MAQLVEFNCEICYRAHLEAAADIVTPERAGTTFNVAFEEATTAEYVERHLRGQVVCPHGHYVDVDDMRGIRDFANDNNIPRGRRVGKQK